MLKNSKVTNGGISFLNNYAPYIPYKSLASQKLTFVKFRNYSSVTQYYLSRPDKDIEVLQYASQNHDIQNDPFYVSRSSLNFYIHQDKEIYDFYPSGIMIALSKLGGLLAILNISMLI